MLPKLASKRSIFRKCWIFMSKIWNFESYARPFPNRYITFPDHTRSQRSYQGQYRTIHIPSVRVPRAATWLTVHRSLYIKSPGVSVVDSCRMYCPLCRVMRMLPQLVVDSHGERRSIMSGWNSWWLVWERFCSWERNDSHRRHYSPER